MKSRAFSKHPTAISVEMTSSPFSEDEENEIKPQ
jgi:hypothetical protein